VVSSKDTAKNVSAIISRSRRRRMLVATLEPDVASYLDADVRHVGLRPSEVRAPPRHPTGALLETVEELRDRVEAPRPPVSRKADGRHPARTNVGCLRYPKGVAKARTLAILQSFS